AFAQTLAALILYRCIHPSRCRLIFDPEGDRIRDATVTGVQTCALPIFLFNPLRRLLRRGSKRESARESEGVLLPLFHGIILEFRSEERRVGKECRSLLSGDDASEMLVA